MAKHRMGYRETLDWLIANDDTEWLDDAYGSISVTAALVADIFDTPQEKVTADLKRRKAKANG